MSPADAEAVSVDTRAARRIRIVDADPGLVLALTQGLHHEGYDCQRIEEGAQVPTDNVLLEVRPSDPLGPVGAVPEHAVAPGLEAAEPSRLVRLDDVIRKHVLEVFHATNDNVTRTALALGISRVALRRRLRAYGAKPPPSQAGEVDDTTR
jgi:DNA-binding NtrC family response regulator